MDSSEERSGNNGHVDGAPEAIAMSPYDGAFAEGPDIIPLSSAKHSVTLDGDSDADGNSSEVESGVENGADAELHINGTSEKYPFPMSGVPCETSAAVDEVLPEEESQTSTDPLQEGLWSEGNTGSPSAVEHSFEQVGTPTDVI